MAAAVAVLLGLAACGGDDDDEPAAATDLVINAANAGTVAGETLHGFLLALNGFDSLVLNNVVLSDTPSGVAVARSKLLRVAPKGGGVRARAVENSTTQCSTSGQKTITVSQAVSGKLAVGDFAEQQFNACVELGVESIGKAREVITAANASQTVFAAKGELTGFGETEAGVTVLASGPYDVTADSSDAAAVKLTASIDKTLAVERRINQKANAAYNVSALKRTTEGNLAAGAINFTIGYAVSGSFPALGAVRFKVNTNNFAISLADGTVTGAIKVTGAGSGSLLLTSLGDEVGSFRMDLDANGDGTIDQTQTKTFDEFLQLVLKP